MDELERIVLQAKEDVYTLLQGESFSKLLGQGYDFLELRVYENSDDIRNISWINSAKSGEPYVKKLHEEKELLVHVSMLLDGRSIIGKKQALMTELLAVLSYSSVFSSNLLEASFTFGSTFKKFESTKNVEAVEDILNVFSKIEVLGLEIDYDTVENRLLKVQEQKSLFFIIGDFLDEINLSILAQKHELCVIMVRDRWEENPIVSADVELVNPLSNKTMNKIASKKVLLHYVQKLEEHDMKLYAHFHQHHIKYVKVYEASEIVERLEQLFYF